MNKRAGRGSVTTLADVPEMLTVMEAAGILRMHRMTILRAIRKGELAAIVPRHGAAGSVDKGTLERLGPGQGYRIKRADLHRWYFGEDEAAS